MGLIGVDAYLYGAGCWELVIHRYNSNNIPAPYFRGYIVDSEKINEIISKSSQFIKINRIMSKKRFIELETLFKLQVLS